MTRQPSSIPPGPVHRPNPARLERVPLFAGLGIPMIGSILRLGRLQNLRRGAALFAQGGTATTLYLLLEGCLKVLQTGDDGRQIVVRFVAPDEPAGVLALLGQDQTYPATVLAVVPSVLLAWSGAGLLEMREDHPALAINAMRALGTRAQEVHARLREAVADPVERRLARGILRLLRQIGLRRDDGTLAVNAPVTRQDLAEFSGTTLHTASRILSGWTQAGILGGGRMRLEVRDERALARIAGA